MFKGKIRFIIVGIAVVFLLICLIWRWQRNTYIPVFNWLYKAL